MQNCKTSNSPGSMSTNPVSSACAGAGGRLPRRGQAEGRLPPSPGAPPGEGGRAGGSPVTGPRSPATGSPPAPRSHLSPSVVSASWNFPRHLPSVVSAYWNLPLHLRRTSYLPPPPPPPLPPLPSPHLYPSSTRLTESSQFYIHFSDFFLKETEFKISPH